MAFGVQRAEGYRAAKRCRARDGAKIAKRSAVLKVGDELLYIGGIGRGRTVCAGTGRGGSGGRRGGGWRGRAVTVAGMVLVRAVSGWVFGR